MKERAKAEALATHPKSDFPIQEYTRRVLREHFEQAFLAGHAAALQWQPIETAPKNGTAVLVAGPECGVCTAWFYHGAGDPTVYGNDSWIYRGDVVCPTHWMPLPEPPKEVPA